MKEFIKGFKAGLAKALYIPPTYADRASDAALAEGWRIAYEQEKERREIAEAKLDLCKLLKTGRENNETV